MGEEEGVEAVWGMGGRVAAPVARSHQETSSAATKHLEGVGLVQGTLPNPRTGHSPPSPPPGSAASPRHAISCGARLKKWCDSQYALSFG
jgi:hypothetical protein